MFVRKYTTTIATVFALKLDKGKVRGWGWQALEQKLTYFSNHEDDIQS